jgi:hypothetical protein
MTQTTMDVEFRQGAIEEVWRMKKMLLPSLGPGV